MDAKSKRAYFLTWGISWVTLAGMLVFCISRPGENLFLDPGTWLATFPVAWAFALVGEQSRRLCTVAQPVAQEKKGSSPAFLRMVLSNLLVQVCIQTVIHRGPYAREWLFVALLSVLGGALCVTLLRKERFMVRTSRGGRS